MVYIQREKKKNKRQEQVDGTDLIFVDLDLVNDLCLELCQEVKYRFTVNCSTNKGKLNKIDD